MPPELAASSNDLVDLLRQRCAETKDHRLYTFLGDGEDESGHLSVAELDRAARGLAARLQDLGLGGERALLLYPPGLDFIAAFFGCLYAGVVAVPAYPPRSRRRDPRLQSILADAEPRAVLTAAELAPRVKGMESRLPRLAGLHHLVSGGAHDAVASDAEDWRRPDVSARTLAFLQYTSGSTSVPKGVQVSHGNLLHNEELIRRAFGQSADSVVVSWLPLYHDMGLIGTVLQPLYSGGRAILMSPVAFLQRPVRWLRAISRYRADTSGGPNFAYELCLRRVDREMRRGLDLSTWRVAFNGAEPVRAETLGRFADSFAECGFRRSALFPCYGLAEATLMVAAGGGEVPERRVAAHALERHRVEAAQPGQEERRLVASGKVAAGLRVEIVDPESGRPCGGDEVGEIWVAGESVAQGYWRRPEATRHAFGNRLPGDPGPFLRTGDLGFLRDGWLFVTGRLKDLVILRGRNHYPQDLERSAEAAHPGLRPAGGAAFSMTVDGEERLVLVHEVERHFDGTVEEVAAAIRQRVSEEHEVAVYEVVLIRAASLPKTTSGKVRRGACRRLFLDGGLKVEGRSRLTVTPVDLLDEEAPELSLRALRAMPAEERRQHLRAWLRQKLAADLSVAAADLPVDRPLTACGLDSLNALELEAEVESGLGVRVAAERVLDGATLDELAALLSTAVGEEAASVAPVTASPAPAAASNLSHGQRALWFLQRLAPESGAYNLAVATRADGSLDVGALAAAAAALMRRHPVLGSRFETVGGEPRQRFDRAAHGGLDVVNAAAWSDRRLRDALHGHAFAPFELERGPLIRLRLYRRAEDDGVLLLVVHHAVADFWSMAILARELAVLHDAARSGRDPALPVLEATAADWAREEATALAGAAGEELWSYWSERLGTEPPVLELPTDRPRPAVQTFRGDARRHRLGTGLARGVEDLARHRGVTPFVVLMAAYQTLLARQAGQRDFAVGTPSTVRPPRFADVVGYFVNPLPLRAPVAGDPTFGELVERVGAEARGALAHRRLPFPLLAEKLHPRRLANRPPVFQTLFSLQAAPPGTPRQAGALALGLAGARVSLGRLRLESVELTPRFSRFDLALAVAPAGGGLALALEYNRDLFDATTAERLLRAYETVLTAAVAEPDRPLSTLPVVTDAQRQQVVREWNDTGAPYPADRCLHDLILERADVFAGRPALVVQEGDALSYGELARRCRRLAEHLRRLGVHRGERVAVCLPGGAALPVSLLAVVAAGGAWVPVDPEYPEQRVALMLEDAAPRVVITSPGVSVPARGAAVLEVDASGNAVAGAPAAGGEEPSPVGGDGAQPEDLAYVIYTSGSTGRPKGVEVPHRAVVNFLVSMARRPGLGADDTLLAVTTPSFDISVLELFLPLLVGARCALVPRVVATDGARLAGALEELGATLLQATPATWKLLLGAGWPGAPGLTALCGGEAMGRQLAADLAPRVAALWNMYGPTETTVWSTVERIAGAPPRGAPVPVGRPIANTDVHLLDAAGRVVAVGVAGELCIGGDGVTRGYLGRPALTADRFVPSPFARRPGRRLYRTGDLARRLPDGRLEHLGRIDQQVKVRGFRIEPGEVESTLLRRPDVREAVVTAPSDASGERRLVAYFVPAVEPPPAADDLRAALAAELPEYMVPSLYVPLDALPLTPNGKVDRKRLPSPTAHLGQGRTAAPRSATEAELAALYRRVLEVEDVGVEDDFFVLGGHSLSAARLVARVRDRFAVDLPLRQVFRAPTVAALAALVDERRESGDAGAPVEPLGATEAPPSFGQERLLFLERLRPGTPVYHMAVAVELRGDLDAAVLATALRRIEERQEALRTRFPERNGRRRQLVVPPATGAVSLVDLTALPTPRRQPEAARCAATLARRPFDLEAGPPWRHALLRWEAGHHRLIVAAHHAVADGASLALFLDELELHYRSFLDGVARPLARPPVQYADFAVWQRRRHRAGELQDDLDWWSRQLAAAVPLELVGDRPRPAVRGVRGGLVSTPHGSAVSSAVETLGRRFGVTPFMVYLAVFQLLLGRYAATDDVVVGAPVSSRDRSELEGLIGFFVNTLPLRTTLPAAHLGALLERVREVVLEAHAHRDAPLELIVEQVAERRSLSHDPLFQVTLALDEVPPAPALPGLTTVLRPLHTGTAKFDLSLFVAPAAGRIDLEYLGELFDPTSARRFLDHYVRLLTSLARRPEAPPLEVPYLSPAERHQLLEEWGRQPVPGEEIPVPRQVAAVARRQPEAPAVVSAAGDLSYGELESRAARLAGLLRRRGIGPEVPVALLLPRHPDLVVAALAVWKAGGAYVALDSGLPARRLAATLRLAAAPLLLSHAALAAEVAGEAAGAGCEILALDELGDLPDVGAGDAGSLPDLPSPRSLAYVIFTSGSTGEPKGVGLEHGGLANLVAWHRRTYGVGAGDRASHVAGLGFDASVWELWPYLSTGAAVHLAPPGVTASPTSLLRWLDGDGITLAFLPTPLAEAVLEEDLPAAMPLRVLLTGGDRLRRHPATPPPFRLVNHYGPTESTVVTTAGEVPVGGSAPPSIGRPISNLDLRVLDRRLGPVPLAVAGELYIAGVALARGYLHRPALTAERFVPDPHGPPGGRMYRSGDLVRWRRDGRLDFLQRADQQVKVRGFRIEPGEIEAVLCGHPGVAEAVVVPRAASGGTRLIAYLVSASDQRPGAGDLAAYLGARLPAYMVPAGFELLEALPLAASGKVDRQALPAPSGERPDLAAGYTAPRSALEDSLCALWSDLLEVERVGVHDDFFALGGHSLQVVELVSRLREEFEVDIEPQAVFRAPTVASLALAMTKALAARVEDEDLVAALASVSGEEGSDG